MRNQPQQQYRRLTIRSCLATAALCLASGDLLADPPFLVGQISDGESQQVIMPKLPGGWQRTIAWMAPEGTQVNPGDVIVRLDPGDLISQEETLRIRLEEVQLSAEAREAEMQLNILDAETAVMEAESNVRIALFNAEVPDNVRPRLNFERDQLGLENARNALIRAEQNLVSANKAWEQQQPVTQINIEHVRTELQSVQDAIAQTEIRADRKGMLIYAENPFTRLKIFPGQTLQPSLSIALVSNQEYLQFSFWVHEADIRKINIGTMLAVTPDALPDQTVRAETIWISNHASTRDDWGEGGYFELTAQPSDSLPKGFLPGMSIMAEIL